MTRSEEIRELVRTIEQTSGYSRETDRLRIIAVELENEETTRNQVTESWKIY